MAYEHSTYRGDRDFPIKTTGDVLVGDAIRFDRGVFGGSFRKPIFLCFERVTGVVVANSESGRNEGSFTIRLPDGKKTRITARNLNKHGVWRQPRHDESARRVCNA